MRNRHSTEWFRQNKITCSDKKKDSLELKITLLSKVIYLLNISQGK